MSQMLVRDNGHFQLWSYSVGHGQLLLRRTKTADIPKQLDILFTNVAAVHIAAAFNTIEITELSSDERTVTPQLGQFSMEGRRIYRIRGKNCEGYIVAGAIVHDESDREYWERSPLLRDSDQTRA